MVSAASLALILVRCSYTAGFAEALPLDTIRVDPSSGHYVDSHGRARIFHGMNVVYKREPWYPPSKTFNPADSLDAKTMDNLREWGFNVVRLGVMWPGVEPVLNQIDQSYLQAIKDLSEQLASRGVYTLADLHQDLGSRRFCGEGFPEHYVDALLQNKTSALALAPSFPAPFAELPLNSTGFPDLADCARLEFGAYYTTYAVGALWSELYTPGTELNRGFSRYWSAVATAFKGVPHLLGYELLNEPSGVCLGGSKDACVESVKEIFNNEIEAQQLTPLYQAGARAIRSAGAQQPILYEATVPPKLHGPVFPAWAIENDTQQGLAYHIYCAPGDADSPLAAALCKATLALYYDTYFPFLRDNKGLAGFMTEFGAVGGNAGELEHLNMLLETADDNLQSWAYWMLKKFGDFTTANKAESLYNDRGELETVKLKALSRTYAQAIAGKPLKMSFDPNTGNFSLDFNATVTSAPTEIYFNEVLHYPNGYVAEYEPMTCLVHRRVDKNHLHFSLRQSSSCWGRLVKIRIRKVAENRSAETIVV